jgi:hypothetical protein
MTLKDTDLDTISGGIISGNTQMGMLNLQSVGSKYSTMLQLITNIMKSTDSTASTIASNIKG